MKIATYTLSLVITLLFSLNSHAQTPAPAAGKTVTETVHQVKGVIREIAADRKSAVIRHEEIPGFMPKMTMKLNVLDTNELAGLQSGDEILFRLHTNQKTHWISQLKRIGHDSKMEQPAAKNASAKRPDPSLEVGDVMPDFTFTDETGHPVTFSQYRGQALAFTFIFTRCPLPDFCPRMGQQFAAARKELLAHSGSHTNWQFLSISFDSEHDTPEVLAHYARIYRGQDSSRWLFAVASPKVLYQLGPLCDLQVTKQNGSISHNLRTVVLDPEGKVFRQFDGNLWTSQQLVGAILEAAQKQPPTRN